MGNLRWLLAVCILSTCVVRAADDEDEDRYRFRFRSLTQSSTRQGQPPRETASSQSSHGLSEAEMVQRQQKVKEFWTKGRSGEITKADVVKLYSIAGDFSVVHALLGNTISSGDSRTIGRLRAEIHEEVLQSVAKSKRFGSKMGVNDFGSGADLSSVDAKTDIDFTLYNKLGIAGADMVAAYKEAFRRITSGYGASIDPGQCDIVAHRYEATLPDWRQGTDVAGFETKLRTGLSLLRSNPEAYFLEGAYMQQVMKRSVDPNAKTFTWYDVEEGPISKSSESAALQKEYFFHPETHERYAFGGAVGNWHFFHAHAGDQVARAKYILRSIDDGVGMIHKDVKKGDFEKMSRPDQAMFIRKVYGGKFGPEVLSAIQATLETSAHMRQLKKDKKLNLLSHEGQVEAYRPLVELLRADNPHASNAEIAQMAQSKFNQIGNAILIENNIQSSTARLADWLQPPLKPGTTLSTVDENGRPKKVHIDADAITRLQYSAFFELHSAVALMDPGLIGRIKKANPRYRRDIEILEGVIRKKQQMMLAPETLHPDEALTWRQQKAAEVQAEVQRLRGVLETHGYTTAAFEGLKSGWDAGQRFETWMQATMVDSLVRTAGGSKYIPILHQMRQEVEARNLEGLGPKWMARLDKGTSIVQVLKAYAREGEINETVLNTAMYEVLSFVPGMGTIFAVQGGVQSMATLTFVNVIPGYGQMFLVLNFAHGAVELAGLLVFEPLKRDKILLAYQGYLPPVEGSWFFDVGQKERVESPRAPLLYPVDPAGALPLEERREKMYHYLHDQVIARMKANPEIWYDETEFPREWQNEEFKELNRFTTEYVDHWWNATGPFSEFDELTVHRGEDIRAELVAMLIKDYIRGKNIALQRKVQERLAAEEQLLAQYQDIAAGEYALEAGAEQLQGDYQRIAEMIQAMILDEMPTIEPSIEIYAAQEFEEIEGAGEDKTTISEQVNLRARVCASFKDHPGPWMIEWTMNNSESGDVPFAVGESTEVEARSGAVTVTAVAKDANGAEIARTSYSMAVEKVKVEDREKQEETEDDETGPTGGIPDVQEIIDELQRNADTATGLTRQAASNCEETRRKSDEASKSLDEVDGKTQQAAANLDRLRGELSQLLTKITRAKTLAQEISELAEKLAYLRDDIQKLALKICTLAEEISKAQSTDERYRLLQQMRAPRSEILQKERDAQRLMDQAKMRLKEIEQIKQDAQNLQEALADADEAIGAIDADLGQADGTVEAANAELTDAGARTTDLEQVGNSSGALVQEGQELLEDHLESSEEARDLAKQMEGLLAQVQQLKRSVEDCPEEAGDVYREVVAKRDAVEKQIQEAHEALVELNQKWNAAAPIDHAEESRSDADATWAVMEIFFDAIGDRVKDSEVCEQLGERAAAMTPTVTVPDVRGLPEAEAIERISKAGLRPVSAIGPAAPRPDLKGKVVGQRPEPGTVLQKDQFVTLVVYNAPEQAVVYSVPRVVGMSSQMAPGVLDGAGFSPVAQEGDPAPSKVQEGQIYNQTPAAGSTFEEKGVPVTFFYYGKTKPVGQPQHTPPPQATPPQTVEEAPPYYVVCKVYLPKPKGKPPEDSDDVEAWYRALTLSDVTFQPAEKSFYLQISGEALNVYPDSTFTAGKKIALPVKIFSKSSQQQFSIKGAILLQVTSVYHDLNLLHNQFPESKKKDAIFVFSNAEGTSTTNMNQKDSNATLQWGPIKNGWSQYMRQEALNLYKQFAIMFKCFVATAIYEGWQHGKLATLRHFRDTVMAQSEAGRRLIQRYYQWGPEAALWIQDHPRIKRMGRVCLDGVVATMDHIDWERPLTKQVANGLIWAIEAFLNVSDEAEAPEYQPG